MISLTPMGKQIEKPIEKISFADVFSLGRRAYTAENPDKKEKYG